MQRILFSLALIVPSTVIFYKYLGLAGTAGYILFAGLALYFLPGVISKLNPRMERIPAQAADWMALGIVAALLLLFFVVYPYANAGVVGGGSDSDDALNLATTELLQGRYPYYLRTYLGNQITPMPGALVLAIPFVLLGNAAYQSFFWLFVFYLVAARWLRDKRHGLLLMATVLVFSPVVVYLFMIGSDYIANSLYILTFMLWALDWIPQPGMSAWRKALPALLLGISLSSRANFLFLLPLLAAALARRVGWKPALAWSGISGLACLALTLPFYLYDPAGFTPLGTLDELAVLEQALPQARLLLPLLTGLLALGLAARLPAGGGALLRSSTLVLAFPALAGAALLSLAAGRPDFGYILFGSFFIFFGAMGFGKELLGFDPSPKNG